VTTADVKEIALKLYIALPPK